MSGLSSRRRLLALLGLAVAIAAVPPVVATASPGGVDRCRPNPGDAVPPGCAQLPGSVIEDVLPDDLPNLVPKRPAVVQLREVDGQPAVAFDTVIVNRGEYALDVLHEPSLDEESLTPDRSAAQCVGWVGPVCRARRSAGAFTYHAAHDHWHFDDFALYELRLLTEEGEPDLSDAGLIGDGEKASFCLQDSEREEPDSGHRFYTACGELYQGISAGWSDVYGAHLPDQDLPIADVPDGRYALVFTVNPEHRLFETDMADNVAWSVIELSNGGTAVEVVGP